MAIRRTEALWTGGLARLLFAALVMALLGFPVAAQAQETPSDPQEQELAEGAQAEQPAEEGEEEELPAESFAGEVVVVGVRESMIEAVEIKRESIPIVDAIVAEDI
ncbi:MAG TPA: hypothetical protein PLS95_14045, partial [Thermoanaerobaculales bacterium]|nr:hypothetical protein [Thermoanaerobaculales bacterium]